MSDGGVPTDASPQALDPHRAITLLDPCSGWRVERGVVDVFVAAGFAGSRRFLYTACDGEALFGLSDGHAGGPALVVVAIEPTRVSRVDVGDASDPASRILVNRWGTRVAEALGDDPRQPSADFQSATDALQAWRARARDRLEVLERQERQRHSRSGPAHAQMNLRAVRHAIRRLAAVTSGAEADNAAGDGSPLLQVVVAVGHRLGLTVIPPDRVDAVGDELAAILRRSGCLSRRVRLTDGWWRRDSGPLVGRMRDDGRAVALLPDGPRRYVLFDPTAGTRTGIDATVASSLAPAARMLYRRLPTGRVTAPSFLRFGLHGRVRDVVVVAACGVAATVLGMVVAPATALLIDQAIPDADRTLLTQLGLGLLAAALGRTLFEVSQAIAATRLETAAAVDVQSAVWARVLNLRLPFLQRFTTGDLYSRIAAVDGMGERLSAVALRAVFAGVAALLSLALLLWYSVWMASWAILLLMIVAAATSAAAILAFRAQGRLQQLAGESLGVTTQIVQNVAKLRVAAAESRAFARWSATYAEQLRLVWRIQRIHDAVNVLLFILPASALSLLFALASGQRSQALDGLTPGTFLAFNAALGTLVGGVSTLCGTMSEALEVLNSWKRAAPLLNAEPEATQSHIPSGRLRGDVALDHVRFRYGPEGPPTLEDISLRAGAGEFIALVGPSGSGKSTILRLLLGFAIPESGTVSYDGQDLLALDVRDVRRQLGVVLQQSRVMSASIFENIAVGAALTLGDAWEAARQAGLAADIESFPMSMHTVVTEGGTNLSGGQRQRLLIARALALKPRVLILDEATSALDNQTQAVVSRSLDALGVTRIVIAHRLSTVRHAHRIYVIDQGRVVECGRFEALIEAGGLFSRLMDRQAL